MEEQRHLLPVHNANNHTLREGLRGCALARLIGIKTKYSPCSTDPDGSLEWNISLETEPASGDAEPVSGETDPASDGSQSEPDADNRRTTSMASAGTGGHQQWATTTFCQQQQEVSLEVERHPRDIYICQPRLLGTSGVTTVPAGQLSHHDQYRYSVTDSEQFSYNIIHMNDDRVPPSQPLAILSENDENLPEEEEEEENNGDADFSGQRRSKSSDSGVSCNSSTNSWNHQLNNGHEAPPQQIVDVANRGTMEAIRRPEEEPGRMRGVGGHILSTFVKRNESRRSENGFSKSSGLNSLRLKAGHANHADGGRTQGVAVDAAQDVEAGLSINLCDRNVDQQMTTQGQPSVGGSSSGRSFAQALFGKSLGKEQKSSPHDKQHKAALASAGGSDLPASEAVQLPSLGDVVLASGGFRLARSWQVEQAEEREQELAVEQERRRRASRTFSWAEQDETDDGTEHLVEEELEESPKEMSEDNLNGDSTDASKDWRERKVSDQSDDCSSLETAATNATSSVTAPTARLDSVSGSVDAKANNLQQPQPHQLQPQQQQQHQLPPKLSSGGTAVSPPSFSSSFCSSLLSLSSPQPDAQPADLATKSTSDPTAPEALAGLTTIDKMGTAAAATPAIPRPHLDTVGDTGSSIILGSCLTAVAPEKPPLPPPSVVETTSTSYLYTAAVAVASPAAASGMDSLGPVAAISTASSAVTPARTPLLLPSPKYSWRKRSEMSEMEDRTSDFSDNASMWREEEEEGGSLTSPTSSDMLGPITRQPMQRKRIRREKRVKLGSDGSEDGDEADDLSQDYEDTDQYDEDGDQDDYHQQCQLARNRRQYEDDVDSDDTGGVAGNKEACPGYSNILLEQVIRIFCIPLLG